MDKYKYSNIASAYLKGEKVHDHSESSNRGTD
jgi:hypothetical protein